ncbi:MAG: hypothetical protein JOS17DRAFT_56660, partial [Linnemannia elongata]
MMHSSSKQSISSSCSWLLLRVGLLGQCRRRSTSRSTVGRSNRPPSLDRVKKETTPMRMTVHAILWPLIKWFLRGERERAGATAQDMLLLPMDETPTQQPPFSRVVLDEIPLSSFLISRGHFTPTLIITDATIAINTKTPTVNTLVELQRVLHLNQHFVPQPVHLQSHPCLLLLLKGLMQYLSPLFRLTPRSKSLSLSYSCHETKDQVKIKTLFHSRTASTFPSSLSSLRFC